jgi:hypothetical protein
MAKQDLRSPDISPPSDVSTLTAEDKAKRERRLVIRPHLIAAAGWPSTQLDLIAEGREPGRLRLHLEATIRSVLDARRNELETSTTADKDDVIAAFADKFRKVSYSPSSNNQLTMHSLVALHLRIPRTLSSDVYLEVQVGPPTVIDIMSLDYKSTRQDAYADRISV